MSRRRGGWNPTGILFFILLMILLQNLSVFVGMMVIATILIVAGLVLRSLLRTNDIGQDPAQMGDVARRIQQELSTLDGFVRELFNAAGTRGKSRPPRSRRESPDDRQALADEAMER